MKSSRSKACRRTSSKGINASNKKSTSDTGLSPSKRHREKLNNVMDELCDLLPLSSEVKTNLDRLSVLKLTVSFFHTKNLAISTDRASCCNGKGERSRLGAEGVNLSELALQAIGGFFLVLTEDGVVYYISENVQFYLGYSQTRLMHQDFFPHVHADDLQGLKSCFDNLKDLCDKDDTINTLGAHQQCFCNIRCHAGRLSSHVSPFYYKCFKFYGHLKPVKRRSKHGSTKYGFFALCSPVDRQAEVFRPLSNNVEKYSCKMDAAYSNLEVDARGLKFLRLGEKDLIGRSSYMFFHPDDLGGMVLVHERLLQENKASMTFRVLKGNNQWQWVRGTGYSIINNGKVEGMISKNFFISDEEGEYFKEQDLKEIEEWKACQTRALPFSQNSNSTDSSSPNSSSTSSESFHSIPTGPPCSQAMDVTDVPEDLPTQYVQPLPQPHKSKPKSSCLVNDDPLPYNDVVMDNDTMLKIIKDLHNSMIDGPNSKSSAYPPQAVPDLFSGSALNDPSLDHNDLPYVDQFTSTKTIIQDGVFDSTMDMPLSSIGCHNLDSNGLNLLNESMLFQHNKLPDNAFQSNHMKSTDPGSIVHLDEHSLADFVPLPLVEVESILSNDRSSYPMTSPYEMPLSQPTAVTDTVTAYQEANSYNLNEQNVIGGGYGITHSVNMVRNQDLQSANRHENNGYTQCSELTNPGSHKYT